MYSYQNPGDGIDKKIPTATYRIIIFGLLNSHLESVFQPVMFNFLLRVTISVVSINAQSWWCTIGDPNCTLSE